jgi:hypothetical protein
MQTCLPFRVGCGKRRRRVAQVAVRPPPPRVLGNWIGEIRLRGRHPFLGDFAESGRIRSLNPQVREFTFLSSKERRCLVESLNLTSAEMVRILGLAVILFAGLGILKWILKMTTRVLALGCLGIVVLLALLVVIQTAA